MRIFAWQSVSLTVGCSHKIQIGSKMELEIWQKMLHFIESMCLFKWPEACWALMVSQRALGALMCSRALERNVASSVRRILAQKKMYLSPFIYSSLCLYFSKSVLVLITQSCPTGLVNFIPKNFITTVVNGIFYFLYVF